jgi:excisionase family DNA binding protein
MTIETKLALTMTVPEAGAKYFGLSRNAAYEAVRRGEMPVIRIGRLLRVPVRALERMLDQAGHAARLPLPPSLEEPRHKL